MFNKTLLVLLFVSGSFTTFAIQGLYLPESENPRGVCKLVAYDFETVRTPVDKNKQPTGAPPIIDIQPELTYCSAEVIGPNSVLTAAHCYEGIFEQLIEYVQSPVRVSHPDEECQGDDWADNQLCIDHYDYFRQEMKFGSVQVQCPNSDGTFEKQLVDVKAGWPNPRFNRDRRTYDVLVLKTEKNFATPPVSITTDVKELREMISNRPDSCRSFGFGLDNDGQVGNLHGTQTPIDTLTETEILNHEGMGHIASGDSGGALICKNPKGEDRLVGVVSQMVEKTLDPYDPSTYETEYFYSNISYNKPWIDFIRFHTLPSHDDTPAGREAYHKVALDYELAELASLIKDAKEIAKEKRSLMLEGDAPVIRKKLREAKKGLRDSIKMKKKGKEPAGFIRSWLKQYFKIADTIIEYCGELQ